LDEVFIAILIGAVVFAWLVAAVVLPIVAIAQTRRLRREVSARLELLEQLAARPSEPSPEPTGPPQPSDVPIPGLRVQPSAMLPPPVELPPAHAQPAAAPRRTPMPAIQVPRNIDWELLIGQRGLGWLAVIVLVFSVAFFLRYAFENQWIGALGRVAIGLSGGVGLVLGGWHYFRRGWRIFSQMMTAAGLVLLYLSTYASFAFYHLIPQTVAGGFLMILVVQSALLAARYDAPAIAFMTLAGGLLTPLLMVSEQDQYISLFIYLAFLNAGVMLLAMWRQWRVLGLAALAGTHALYWMWYSSNYHPEKLVAALCFHGVVFALFLGHNVAAQWFGARRMGWPEIVLLVINPFAYFGAIYVLLNRDYGQWLGTVAIVLATAYVVLCRLLMVPDRRDNRVVLAALAVAVGFVSLAFPIQADAAWVALGWASVAAALCWFGCRIQAVTLRALAAVLGALAVGKLVLMDTPLGIRAPFIPLMNAYGSPALAVAACVLGSVVLTRRFQNQLARVERGMFVVAALVGLLLLWFIFSVETAGYFATLAATRTDPARWRWTGQMALSILWAAYASTLLAIGLATRLAPLRWLALVIFAITVGKVFLVDMATLHAFYRILAFLVLALLLAVAARAYQRLGAKVADVPALGSET
jgi:uncharacterized membrane protein